VKAFQLGTMTSTNENRVLAEAKGAWSVVVVYEDAAARERAVAFCDQLVGRYWAQLEFNLSWWSFAALEDAGSAKDAAENAVCADLVAVATGPEGDFPLPVKAWVETWLTRRGEREGMLVGLLEPLAEAGALEGPKHHYLRHAAHHGAMDYLTHVPQDISLSIPESLDSYSQRADQVTSLLDDILHRQAPPPQLLP
jgi:hypothetical protein